MADVMDWPEALTDVLHAVLGDRKDAEGGVLYAWDEHLSMDYVSRGLSAADHVREVGGGKLMVRAAAVLDSEEPADPSVGLYCCMLAELLDNRLTADQLGSLAERHRAA